MTRIVTTSSTRWKDFIQASLEEETPETETTCVVVLENMAANTFVLIRAIEHPTITIWLAMRFIKTRTVRIVNMAISTLIYSLQSHPPLK